MIVIDLEKHNVHKCSASEILWWSYTTFKNVLHVSFWYSIYQTKLVDFLIYTTPFPCFSHWFVHFPVIKPIYHLLFHVFPIGWLIFQLFPNKPMGDGFFDRAACSIFSWSCPSFRICSSFSFLKKCGAVLGKGHRCGFDIFGHSSNMAIVKKSNGFFFNFLDTPQTWQVKTKSPMVFPVKTTIYRGCSFEMSMVLRPQTKGQWKKSPMVCFLWRHHVFWGQMSQVWLVD